MIDLITQYILNEAKVFFNDQFYISAIEYETVVSEPGILTLLSIGLIGVGAAARRRK